MMEQHRKKLRLWLWLLAVNLVIIWGNSLLPGEISAAISNSVKNFLMKFLPAGPNKGQSGGGLIRKLAHFMEFTCLGICFSQIFRFKTENKAKQLWLPFVCGAAAAAIDELIQRFVPDRGPSVLDVGLDTLGVVMGIFIISLIHENKKRKHNKMEEMQL